MSMHFAASATRHMPSVARLGAGPWHHLGTSRHCRIRAPPPHALLPTRWFASSRLPTKQSSSTSTTDAKQAAFRAARRQDDDIEPETKAHGKGYTETEYAKAARKWISSMIALPILLVTSYHLFDRLVLGHAQKTLPETAPHSG